MEARRGGRRKPVITIRAAEGPGLGEVRLRELPEVFGGMTKGSERVWLQYVNDDLSMVHRTYYVAELNWDGRQLHQVETEYYEPEFPDARLWMQEWFEESGDAWRRVMWGQRYPNATAELRSVGGLVPRVVRPGMVADDGWTADSETFTLDSCSQFQAPCLRLWHEDGDMLREYYVDAEGNCLYGRYWWPGKPAGDRDLERGGKRHGLAWEQIPNRLVRPIWAR